MGDFAAYNIAVAPVFAAMYIGYKYFLSGEKLIAYNRALILAATAVCFLLPALTATGAERLQALAGHSGGFVGFDAGEVTALDAPQASTPLWPLAAAGIYYAGVAVAAIMTAVDYVRLHRLISSGERVSRGDGGYIVVLSDTQTAPFSWYRYIVMHRADYGDESQSMILAHEQAHLRRLHSLDMAVMQLVCILQWFNPAAWLLRDELKNVHEYQADSDVLSANADARQYQMLLIKKAVGSRFPSLANSLNHSNLKKRITMMQKSDSKPVRKMRSGVVLAAMSLAACAVCHPAVASRLDSMRDSATLTTETPGKVTTKPVETQATPQLAEDTAEMPRGEVMPKFPGDVAGLSEYLSANMQYPEAAQRAGKQGRVVVTFVIDKDGSIKEAKVERGVDADLDAEALRLVRGMPAWTPGYRDGKPVKVRYTLPVTFKLK